MNSLTLKEKTFKEIERKFFEIGCEVAKMLMGEFLLKLYEELCKNRNKTAKLQTAEKQYEACLTLKHLQKWFTGKC